MIETENPAAGGSLARGPATTVAVDTLRYRHRALLAQRARLLAEGEALVMLDGPAVSLSLSAALILPAIGSELRRIAAALERAGEAS